MDESFENICEADINMTEVENAMKGLTPYKSPCSHGLTSNFYRHFWEHLKDPFFQMLKEITKSNIPPTTMKQGIITFIPKLGKDSKVIDILRATTLLKSGITQIMSETQSVFFYKRTINPLQYMACI